VTLWPGLHGADGPTDLSRVKNEESADPDPESES
jgi:hypothetical protein